MTSGGGSAKARCIHCREQVQVSDRYAQGDHIKCGSCGTKHKVVRGDRLRLVLADPAPVRDALAQNDALVARLESDLVQARLSFGIGANGAAIGVGYALYRVLAAGAPVDAALVWQTVGIALGSAALLEAASWAFLVKRQRMTRLARELDEARVEGMRLRQLLREASKL